MRVLLTGHRGILGGHLSKELLKTAHFELVRFPGDITSIEEVNNFFVNNQEFDIVVHLAALVSVQKVNNDTQKALLTNCFGTQNILMAVANQWPEAHFIHISTSHVYGQKK